MPDPCECPMRKALEHLRKSCEGTLLLAYIDAALSAPCPCGELREGGERLKEELRYEVRNAAWEAEQAQSATAERDQLRAELTERDYQIWDLRNFLYGISIMSDAPLMAQMAAQVLGRNSEPGKRRGETCTHIPYKSGIKTTSTAR